MKKTLFLSVLFMLILTGCFDKKTRIIDDNISAYLDVSDLISVDETGEIVNISDGSNPDSNTIINISELVPIDSSVTLSFVEILDEQTVDNFSIYIIDKNLEPIASEVTVVDNQIIVTPNEFFLPDERYSIVITTAVKDIQGSDFGGILIYNFLTTSLPDTTPPTLTLLTPTDGAIDVAKTTDVIMTFNENIANNGAILEVRDSLNVLVAGSNTISGNTLTFNPTSDLNSGETYTVTLINSVEDLSGNSYTGISTWSFTTILLDTTPPTLTLLTPTDGAIDVAKTTDVIMTFNENIANNGAILEVRDSLNVLVAGSNTISGNTLTFNPTSDLNSGETYTVTLINSVEDLSGNSYTGISTWSFTTILLDTTPPTLTLLTPTDGAIDVAKTTDVIMTFNENIANNGAILEVRDSLNVLVAGTNTISGNTLTFNPTSDLNSGETYMVTLINSVEDLSGNSYTGISTWSFTVADTIEPILVSVIPGDGAINVDKATDINVTFDENITGALLLLTNNTLGMSVSGTSGITGNTLWFIPDGNLTDDNNYTIAINGLLRDLAGNSYTGETSWSFRVAPLVDITSPILTSLTPEANASNVDKTTDIVMTFNENISAIGVTLDLNDSLGNLVNISSTVSGNTLTFNPDDNLTAEEMYTVTLLGTVKDLAGNDYNGTSSWSFTIAPLVDIIPPALVSLTPEANATHVDTSTDIIMTFDENIADNNVTLDVRDSFDTPVTGNSMVSGNSLIFNPTNDLTEGETYTVELTLTDDVQDLSDNIYDRSISTWSFTVVDLPVSMLSVIRIRYDHDYVKIEFYEKLNKEVVNESDFIITDSNGTTIGFSELKFGSADHEAELVTADNTINGDEIITVSGTVVDVLGNVHNSGVADDYNITGILSVYDVKEGGGDTVTVKFLGISSIINPATVDVGDFTITDSDDSEIPILTLIMKNDYEVEFTTAEDALNGDELVTISGDIQDMDGNFHNNGNSVSHAF